MEWVNAVVQGILLGGLYALFATGLSLAFGVLRFVNLAHGDLAILGAYLAFSSISSFDVSVWTTFLIVAPLMFVVGYVAQRGLFDFTLGNDPLPGILVSFGLGVVIQNALLVHYSATDRGLSVGSLATERIRISDDISIGWFPLVILMVAVALLGGLQLLLSFTRTGRAFRAVSDDRDTARLMGINVRNLYGVAMGIAFATVAIAGIFLGSRTTFSPAQGPANLLFAFEAVVIGGLGSLWGTLLGGIVLGVAQTTGNQIDVSYGWLGGVLLGHLVFLAVLAFRPSGLLGARS
jgi:branched-chain amino acid transport system permease protein